MIKVKNLIGELNIHATNMDEATETIKNKVTETLASAVKDFEMCKSSIKEEPVVQTTENSLILISKIINCPSFNTSRKFDLIERVLTNVRTLSRELDRESISLLLKQM